MEIKLINNSNNELPEYKTTGSSGMDVRAYINSSYLPFGTDHYVSFNGSDAIQLGAGERCIIPTGLKVADIPEELEIQVRSRSGLAAKRGLMVLNSPGTIDSDYRGEIGIILYNASNGIQIIESGDRIAQLVVCPVVKVEVRDVNKVLHSSRGEGGFGSTGDK